MLTQLDIEKLESQIHKEGVFMVFLLAARQFKNNENSSDIIKYLFNNHKLNIATAFEETCSKKLLDVATWIIENHGQYTDIASKITFVIKTKLMEHYQCTEHDAKYCNHIAMIERMLTAILNSGGDNKALLRSILNSGVIEIANKGNMSQIMTLLVLFKKRLSVDQGDIIYNLVKYLVKYNRIDITGPLFVKDADYNGLSPKIIERLKLGLCNGLTFLFLFCKYMQTQVKQYGVQAPVNNLVVLDKNQKISSLLFAANANTLVIMPEQNLPSKTNKVYLVKNPDHKPASTTTSGSKISMESFEIELTDEIEILLRLAKKLNSKSLIFNKIAAKCTKPRDDYDWFKFVIKTILDWDGERELTAPEQATFETFFTHVNLFQSSYFYPELFANQAAPYQYEADKFLIDTKNRSPINEYFTPVPSITTEQEIVRLLQIPNLIQEGKMIYITGGSNDKQGRHAVGLIKNGTVFSYFDANSNNMQAIESGSITKIAAALFKSFFNLKASQSLDKQMMLELNSFSMTNNTQHAAYPTHSEVLCSIHPIFRAIKEKNGNDIIRLVRDPSVDFNIVDGFGATPLSWATYDNDATLVKVILSRQDIDVNVVATSGCYSGCSAFGALFCNDTAINTSVTTAIKIINAIMAYSGARLNEKDLSNTASSIKIHGLALVGTVLKNPNFATCISAIDDDKKTIALDDVEKELDKWCSEKTRTPDELILVDKIRQELAKFKPNTETQMLAAK